LDAIPGVGPARRKALLGHFGSIDRIQVATIEELMQLPGITEAVARSILSHLE
jgi:excinuclease ABC subunit C